MKRKSQPPAPILTNEVRVMEYKAMVYVYLDHTDPETEQTTTIPFAMTVPVCIDLASKLAALSAHLVEGVQEAAADIVERAEEIDA